MRSKRPAFTLPRIALAVVFAFMSLGHGPLMTFAHARTAPTHHDMISDDHVHAAHHGTVDAKHANHAAPGWSASPSQTLLPGTAAVCYSVGCFVSLASPAVDAPAAGWVPVGKLVPAAAPVIAAVPVEPADPPPRLQV